MEQNILNDILEKHKKWLDCEADGERADMSGADLRDADLRGADLRDAYLHYADMRGADLREADLRGADIDYSAWSLRCGSLKAHVDDRIAIQLLYHTLSVVQYSPHVSEEVKRALLTDTAVDIANRFHRANECGKLEAYPVMDE